MTIRRPLQKKDSAPSGSGNNRTFQPSWKSSQAPRYRYDTRKSNSGSKGGARKGQTNSRTSNSFRKRSTNNWQSVHSGILGWPAVFFSREMEGNACTFKYSKNYLRFSNSSCFKTQINSQLETSQILHKGNCADVTTNRTLKRTANIGMSNPFRSKLHFKDVSNQTEQRNNKTNLRLHVTVT